MTNWLPNTLLTSAAALAFIWFSPFDVEISIEDGKLKIEPSFAHAESGKGSEGDGRSDDDSDDDKDDSSGSGSGSDDDDDDDDDDRSGSSSDDDDDEDDDRSGSGSGSGSSGSGSGSGSAATGGDGSGATGPVSITKIESTATSIEVRYSDGTKEEIENGIYERKNAANRTVEERPATQADIDRLRGQTGSVSIDNVRPTSGSNEDPNRVVKAEKLGNKIEVTYATGWKEEIENGIYELKDPRNRTVVERPATAADIDRLTAALN